MSVEEKKRILRGVDELTDLTTLRKNKSPLDKKSAKELRDVILAEYEPQLRALSER
jgi:hypothetical protein